MIASTTRLLTVAATTALVMTTAYGQETFQGDLTTYTLGQTSAGNCNFMSMTPEASTKYAAINDAQWSGSMTCGRCAEVSCIDDRCADKSKKEIVYIVDRCPECKQGDLDVSPDVFKSVTGSGPSRLKTQWRFVSCPVQGNIKYCLKDGSNEFWTAVQPANVAKGVKSLTINGKTTSMVTSAYYFLIEGQGSAKADLTRLRVSVTSIDGEVIEDTVSLSAGKCVEGSAQFGKGQRPSPGGDEPRPTVAPYPIDPPATPAPTVSTNDERPITDDTAAHGCPDQCADRSSQANGGSQADNRPDDCAVATHTDGCPDLCAVAANRHTVSSCDASTCDTDLCSGYVAADSVADSRRLERRRAEQAIVVAHAQAKALSRPQSPRVIVCVV
ncbi:hypothetical protein PINS_up006684 [Pythium insidiosum]|nr:hypothetical protein PINS_up006684 [Pythium insidiosum]